MGGNARFYKIAANASQIAVKAWTRIRCDQHAKKDTDNFLAGGRIAAIAWHRQYMGEA